MTDVPDFKKEVLDRIKAGEVRMRPKAFFVTRMFFMVILSVLILAVSAFIASYILFILQAGGETFLLGFGWRGLLVFLIMFPWFAVVVDLALLAALDSLCANFRFGYRFPAGYLFAATGLTAVLIACAINITSIHQKVMSQAQENRMPVLGRFYDRVRHSSRQDGIFKGAVVSVATSSFEIRYEFDEDDMPTVILMPDGMPSIAPGDHVFVAGEAASGTIRAYGVRRMPSW